MKNISSYRPSISMKKVLANLKSDCDLLYEDLALMYKLVNRDTTEDIDIELFEEIVSKNIFEINEINMKHSPYLAIKTNKFYKLLPANLKKHVMDVCLEESFEHMHYFFNDYNLNFQTSKDIQRSLLSYMEVRLY